ncbi:hypothetical protein ADA01nite_17930 [Aneurinibacillus danicus]|uniref:Uncharacterized protein n=1 Tax=Aneurinibacillus danicus TaxID=267746 RepID=A0A511V9R8_9BACL|nr:hypothetical protein ADA01nite_17930 [Aneurinibacillus danicus]
MKHVFVTGTYIDMVKSKGGILFPRCEMIKGKGENGAMLRLYFPNDERGKRYDTAPYYGTNFAKNAPETFGSEPEI